LGSYSSILAGPILKTILVLFILFAVIGFLISLIERKANPGEFGGTALAGFGAGFWWSAVTMASVGYGDKVPRTFLGRALGVVWMLASLVIVASFTATITSALTVARLETGIEGPNDLAGHRIGTILGSTSDHYLKERHIEPDYFGSVEDALDAVSKGTVDAAVYDAPILRYAARQNSLPDVVVLPQYFDPQNYGFALRTDSPQRELINRAMLRAIAEEPWRARLTEYFGDE
jgi:ABC-type amino acid transport substrate-binding protein